ncbi:MAG: glycerophosphoryl diester phosphodiesterase [Actinomycetota bacterium]
MSSPRILGHRGASSVRKENTLEAFLLAGELGGDGVELDVRRTADGALAVHHDANLEDGRLIVDLPVASLPPYVPQLRDVLLACAGMYVNIEIKNVPIDADWDPGESVAGAVAALVDELGIAGSVIVSSFGLAAINAVRDVNPAIPTAWLTIPNYDQLRAIDTAVEHGHIALHPHFTVVTKELIDAADAAGIVVNTWTVDDPEQMKRVADLGVASIVTNDVALAVATLR